MRSRPCRSVGLDSLQLRISDFERTKSPREYEAFAFLRKKNKFGETIFYLFGEDLRDRVRRGTFSTIIPVGGAGEREGESSFESHKLKHRTEWGGKKGSKKRKMKKKQNAHAFARYSRERLADCDWLTDWPTPSVCYTATALASTHIYLPGTSSTLPSGSTCLSFPVPFQSRPKSLVPRGASFVASRSFRTRRFGRSRLTLLLSAPLYVNQPTHKVTRDVNRSV